MAQEFSTIILAAGRGTRMKSSLSKVLHPVLGVPIIDSVIQQAQSAGSNDIVVVVGHNAQQLTDHFANTPIRLALQEKQLGTADALLAAVKKAPPANNDVLVLNGDLPAIDPDMLDFLIGHHRSSCAAFTIGTSVVDHPEGMGRIVRNQTGQFRQIVEHQDADEAILNIDEVNLGLYCIDVTVVEPHLDQMVQEDLKINSGRQESYLTRLVEVLIENDVPVEACCSPSAQHFLQVNDRVELAEVSRQMVTEIQKKLMESGVTIVDPVTTWIESDVEIGIDTVIHPQTVIRNGVRIGSDCEIGPFAHLRSGTVIGNDVKIGDFVEINRSQLEDGVRAKHLAYLGDTTVHEKANIGAGAVIANYDGKVKSPTTIGAGAFVGSGAVIVAPGTVGDKAVVGAGAVVPPRQNVEPGSTVVGVPARKIKRDQDSNPEIREDEREIQ